MNHCTLLWRVPLLLFFTLLGCIDQDGVLFEQIDQRASPNLADQGVLDMTSQEDAACVPLACSPGECGVRLDRCNRVIDCGPCSSARCPASFETLLTDVLNPRLSGYDPLQDALIFTSENGSNHIRELDLSADRSTVPLTNTGSVQDITFGASAVYRTPLKNGGVWRVWRAGVMKWEPKQLAPDGLRAVSLASAPNDVVWVGVEEPAALWSFTTPSLVMEKALDLPEPPEAALMVTTPTHLWWVGRDGANWVLRAMSLEDKQVLAASWPLPGEATQLERQGDGVCLGLTKESSASLHCLQSPSDTLQEVKRWNQAILLDFEVLGQGRFLVARTLAPSYNKGWQVTRLEASDSREAVLFDAQMGNVSPAIHPIASDGSCAFIAYQYSYRVQRDVKGDIGWISID